MSDFVYTGTDNMPDIICPICVARLSVKREYDKKGAWIIHDEYEIPCLTCETMISFIPHKIIKFIVTQSKLNVQKQETK